MAIPSDHLELPARPASAPSALSPARAEAGVYHRECPLMCPYIPS